MQPLQYLFPPLRMRQDQIDFPALLPVNTCKDHHIWEPRQPTRFPTFSWFISPSATHSIPTPSQPFRCLAPCQTAVPGQSFSCAQSNVPEKNYHLKYPQMEGVLWCLHFLFNEHTVTHSNTVWSYNQTSCLISDFTMSRSEIFKVHPLNQLSHSSSALRNFISSPWRSLRLMEVCPPQSCNLYCVWIYNLRNEQVWQWSGDNQEPIPRHWPLWVSKPEGTQWLRPFWAKTRPRDTKFPCGASAMGMTGTKASDIIFGRSSNGESCNTLRLEIYVQQSQPNHPTRFKFTSQHRQ